MISEDLLRKINERRRREGKRAVAMSEARHAWSSRPNDRNDHSADFFISYMTGFPYPSLAGSMLSPNSVFNNAPSHSHSHSPPAYSGHSAHESSHSSYDSGSSSYSSSSSSSDSGSSSSGSSD